MILKLIFVKADRRYQQIRIIKSSFTSFLSRFSSKLVNIPSWYSLMAKDRHPVTKYEKRRIQLSLPTRTDGRYWHMFCVLTYQGKKRHIFSTFWPRGYDKNLVTLSQLFNLSWHYRDKESTFILTTFCWNHGLKYVKDSNSFQILHMLNFCNLLTIIHQKPGYTGSYARLQNHPLINLMWTQTLYMILFNISNRFSEILEAGLQTIR